MKKIGSILSLLSLFGIVGLHWILILFVAYGKMISQYSSNYGVESGITMTFDGKHPCSICKKVSKEQFKEAKKMAWSKSLKKASPMITPSLTIVVKRNNLFLQTLYQIQKNLDSVCLLSLSPPPKSFS
ncbi:hypothetical protein [Methylacidiphilum caldifontis]|uniref:Uncharacterized protein n=1 Tax=Methylacidiphilum caldifontis TaxID=2795386 RepID=A0A4Y8PF96_9BACT|nr:hypothetical protein [Methylacidiphilum caldifontis]QSR88419.1 hypothetical protein IT6_08570 [Methylacidiphilum caldifontis]TFE70719.1 hypothetical protein A7Q10_06585 [Methylacidiphilum caldifontis]